MWQACVPEQALNSVERSKVCCWMHEESMLQRQPPSNRAVFQCIDSMQIAVRLTS